MGILDPEKYFSRISHIGIERDLLARGIDSVMLDIDNTILARDTHEVPRDVAVWLAAARTAGVRFCLVSNNWHANVLELAESLDLPIVAKACKPLPHGFFLGMRKIGAGKKQTVVIGDQMNTDVLGAHLAGLPVYLLQPLVEQDLAHTLFMRNFERMVLKGRQPEPAACVICEDASTEPGRDGM